MGSLLHHHHAKETPMYECERMLGLDIPTQDDVCCNLLLGLKSHSFAPGATHPEAQVCIRGFRPDYNGPSQHRSAGLSLKHFTIERDEYFYQPHTLRCQRASRFSQERVPYAQT